MARSPTIAATQQQPPINLVDLKNVFDIRMRKSYKRILKTWIRFANPWICFVLWSRILTPKRFVSFLTKRILDLYCIVDHKSWLKKDLFWIVNHESSQFSKIRPVFMNPTNPHKSSWILCSIAPNKSLKIRICESRIIRNSDLRTCKSGFASPNLNFLYCGVDL